MSFSIIIPFYNAQDLINKAVNSILSQQYKGNYEIILVDDCSSDNSYYLAYQLSLQYDFIILLKTPSNSGPGEARNLALNYAKNDYIIFLDVDDILCKDSLNILSKYVLSGGDFFAYSMGGGCNIIRNDIDSLNKDKESLLKDYIALKMDGSAIFGIYKREFLNKYNIRFTRFFHEDVFFMFLVYWFCNNIKIINEAIYKKQNCKDSITNSIGIYHIDGFFLAYDSIYNVIKDKYIYLESYNRGLVGVVAVKLRDIKKYILDDAKRYALYDYLYTKIINYKINTSYFQIQTKYLKLFSMFVSSMKNNIVNKYLIIDSMIEEILSKSWSCYDLHNSLFLASDEIRVCCKRFFVDGKKKGDVVLLKFIDDTNDIFNDILKSKKDLFKRINLDNAKQCYGCPHLEFKNWDTLDKLQFEKISFEYHSVCNMRCIYCSPKYYGGKKPVYDIEKLIDNFIDNNSLETCKSIVWGGGEPTIDKHFDYLITNIAQNINFKQMVITNALYYSHVVQLLLDRDKITITTSIDSGNDSSFKHIRGVNGINKVFYNLKLYAKKNPKNITIKYILMNNNSSKSELENFVSKIICNNLTLCNFQISCNFNDEKVSDEIIFSASFLYALLKKENIAVVFFDELLRERMTITSKDNITNIKESLKKYGLDSYIEDSANYDSICIWGNNTQTKLLLQKSLFLKDIKHIEIIDCNSVGEKILDFTICNPAKFLESDIPILISAVQGTPRIYYEFLKMGFDKNRLIKGIVF